jgi:hypothetical protein
MERQRWYRLYGEAVLELDLTKLEERIEAAALAIREREIELRFSDTVNEELRMIADAKATLGVLRRKELVPAKSQEISGSA